MRPVHQCALRFASCLDSETHVVNMLLHVVRHVCRGAAMFSDPPQVPRAPFDLPASCIQRHMLAPSVFCCM